MKEINKELLEIGDKIYAQGRNEYRGIITIARVTACFAFGEKEEKFRREVMSSPFGGRKYVDPSPRPDWSSTSYILEDEETKAEYQRQASLNYINNRINWSRDISTETIIKIINIVKQEIAEKEVKK